jgi:REP element-mobilizing transposase RayT
MRKPFTQLYCHLVWATWDRQPLILPSVEPRLYGAIAAKVRELRGTPIAIGGVEDHVHLLCSFDPTVAVAYLVQQVKGSSSHLMNHEVLPGGDFKWQGAYGAFTVGQDALEDVRGYVLGQKHHHESRTEWPDWERTWLPETHPQG